LPANPASQSKCKVLQVHLLPLFDPPLWPFRIVKRCSFALVPAWALTLASGHFVVASDSFFIF
jgi:hypothetical protein